VAAGAGAHGDRPASRGYVLAVLTAMTAFNHLDRNLMNILLEPIRREFALSDVQLGLLSGFSFALVFTTAGIPAAVWAVRHDRRNLIAAAVALWGAMTALCGLAQNFWQILLARVGVGVGEAGGPAPSHAMLSDLYRPGERATAMAIFTAGINAGVILSFLVGGIAGQIFGWRAAFVIAGIATILLGLLFRFTVRDPPRSGAAGDIGSLSLVGETTRAMWRDPAMRQTCYAAILASLVAYTVVSWTPSFLQRSHGMSLSSIGTYLALLIGVGGALGTYAGGRLSDALGRRDMRWSLWLFSVAFVTAAPLVVAFYLVHETWLALLLFVFPAMIGTIYLGPSVAVLHDRVAAHLRPIASAVFILTITLIGLGLGPLLTGAISEYGFAGYGEDSLRYALAVMQVAALWCALHFYLAGRHLRATPPR
jgi:predicted MFS family arabinose efflux permease